MTSPQDETPRKRLARLMDERRAELRPRLRWSDVAKAAGLTTEGLRGIRFGTGDIRPLTKRGIEDALRWAQGSINTILAGGAPTPVQAAPSEPQQQKPGELSDLSYGELAARVEELMEQRAQRRREDEVLDQEVTRVLEQLRRRDRDSDQRAG